MADDIDIEDHDLSDDEVGIFPDYPDLSFVKSEVIDIEDGFDQHVTSPVPSTSVIPDSTTDVDFHPQRSTESPHIISSTSIQPEDLADPSENKDEEITDLIKDHRKVVIEGNIDVVDNGLELGSAFLDVTENFIIKINKNSVINDNNDDVDASEKGTEVAADPANFFGNCIILGNKSANVDRVNYIEDKKCFNSFVALEDWGPYLDKSDCYCPDCEILFATINALDFHKMQSHSHLVAVLEGEADGYSSVNLPYRMASETSNKITCTLCGTVLLNKLSWKKHMYRKHSPARNVSNVRKRAFAVKSGSKFKVSDITAQGAGKGDNVCFVCQLQCHSDDDLINHLYNFHTFKCEVCETVFAKKEQYEVHLLSHTSKTIKTKAKETNANVDGDSVASDGNFDPTDESKVIPCKYCTSQFVTKGSLIRHHEKFHAKQKKQPLVRRKFNPVCPICQKQYPTIRSCNKHSYTVHLKILVARCPYCPKQFTTKQLYDSHFNARHKNLPKTNVKFDQPFNPKCPTCGKYFMKKAHFNIHMESHERENVKKKKKNNLNTDSKPINTNLSTESIPEPLKLPVNTTIKKSFHCFKCALKFVDMKSAMEHYDREHGGQKSQMIKKVTDQISFIQKTALFQCNMCDIHFTSWTQADSHLSSNCDDNDSVPCTKCHSKIFIKDMAMHNQVHEINDDFKIVVMGDTKLYAMILCKCPTCKLHFQECDILVHAASCSQNALIPYWCNQCHLYIDMRAKSNHDVFHGELALKKDSLIVLEYAKIVKSTVVTEIENKVSNVVAKSNSSGVDKDAYSQKIKDIERITRGIYKMIYCKFCHTYRTFSNSMGLHANGSCRRLGKRVCNLCGLWVSNLITKHNKTHNTDPNLCIKNTLFFDKELNAIKPPLPRISECTRCLIRFPTKHYKRRHVCGETASEYCKICRFEFHKEFFKHHMQYHNYKLIPVSGLEYAAPNAQKIANPGEPKIEDAEELSMEDDDNSTEKEKIKEPAVQKKATPIPKKKIILYQCARCKASSINEEVERYHKLCHSCTYNCTSCKIRFVMSNRLKHITMHEEIPNFNSSHFFIKQFQPRTPDTVVNKTSKNPIKESFVVLYQCSICNLVSTNRLISQKHTSCSKAEKSFKCNVCNYSCFSEDMLNHVLIHKKHPNLKSNAIVISLFDPDSNVAAKQKKKAGNPLQFQILRKALTAPQDKRRLKLHQCSNCKITSSSFHFPYIHLKCFKRNYTCPICHIKVTDTYKSAHEKMHKKDPKLNRNSFKIIPFKPCTNSASLLPKKDCHKLTQNGKIVLFQCMKCDLVSSSRLITTMHRSCTKTDEFYKCLICGYKCFMSYKAKHIATHKDRPDLTTSDIYVTRFNPVIDKIANDEDDDAESSESENKYIILRCEICDVCTEDGLEHDCEEGTKKIVCGICSLTFTESNYPKHAAKHRDPDFTENITVVPIEGETPSYFRKRKLNDADGAPKQKIQKISEVFESRGPWNVDDEIDETRDGCATIYKCPCNLHFLKYRSLLMHRKCCNNEPTQYINNCKFCNINFYCYDLSIHIAKHHTDKQIDFKYIIKVVQDKQKSTKIYRCRDCKLYFPTFIDFKSKTHICGITRAITCKICKLEIMEGFIENHMSTHSNGGFTDAKDYQVVHLQRKKPVPMKSSSAVVQNILFRCPKCEIHFVNEEGVQSHYPCEPSNRRPLKCHECGLRFYSSSLYAHMSIHHNKLSDVITDVVIKEVIPEEKPEASGFSTANVTKMEVSTIENKEEDFEENTGYLRKSIYKCLVCKICFVHAKSMMGHTDCTIDTPAPHFDCDICNLKVYDKEKDQHYRIHHCDGSRDLSCEDDFTIYGKTPYHHRNCPQKLTTQTPRRCADKYPSFGCRQSKPKHKITKPKLIIPDSGVIIFRCYDCDLCFLHKRSFCAHIPLFGPHVAAKTRVTCEECHLSFGPIVFRQHKQLHHIENNYKLEDFKFVTIDDIKLEKSNGLNTSAVSESDKEDSFSLSCTKEDNVSTATELLMNETNKLDESNDNITDTENSKRSETPTTSAANNIKTNELNTPKESLTLTPLSKLDEANKVKFYRCKECNVNYIKQNQCYRHVMVHEALSTFDFLECKICTLNFPLQYLQQHMSQHKSKDFSIEDILIEEYEPLPLSERNNKKAIPKIDIYNAVERDSKNAVISTKITNMSDNNVKPKKANPISDTSKPVIEEINNEKEVLSSITEQTQHIISDLSEVITEKGIDVAVRRTSDDNSKTESNKIHVDSNEKADKNVENPNTQTLSKQLEDSVIPNSKQIEVKTENDQDIAQDQSETIEDLQNSSDKVINITENFNIQAIESNELSELSEKSLISVIKTYKRSMVDTTETTTENKTNSNASESDLSANKPDENVSETDTHTSKIETSASKIVTNESKFNTGESEIYTSESKIDTSENKIITSEGQIDIGESKLGTSKSQIDTSENEIVTSESKIDRSENKIDTSESDRIDCSKDDISLQSMDIDLDLTGNTIIND